MTTNSRTKAAPSKTDTNAVEVKLSELIVDPENQIRVRFDPKTADRYASAMYEGVKFPPITIAVLNGAPVLVDGFHRVAAAKQIGLPSLPAIIADAKLDELLWIAAEANLKHGLALKRNDARAVFRAYVQAGKCFNKGGAVKSSREIKRDLHGIRSHETFLKWMKEDYPDVSDQMIRDDDEPRHDGGEPEVGRMDQRMKSAVLDHLAKAKAAMRGIADPDLRGEMIAEAEEVVEAMRNLGPWNRHEIEF